MWHVVRRLGARHSVVQGDCRSHRIRILGAIPASLTAATVRPEEGK